MRQRDLPSSLLLSSSKSWSMDLPSHLLHYQVVFDKHTQVSPSVLSRNAEVHQRTDLIVSFMLHKHCQHRNTQSVRVARYRTDHVVLSNIDKIYQKERKPSMHAARQWTDQNVIFMIDQKCLSGNKILSEGKSTKNPSQNYPKTY